MPSTGEEVATTAPSHCSVKTAAAQTLEPRLPTMHRAVTSSLPVTSLK